MRPATNARPLEPGLGQVAGSPAGAATLITLCFVLLALLDLVVLRSLHEVGTLDRTAAAVDDIVFLLSLPGIVLSAGILPTVGHHRPPGFFLLATALNAALLWPLVFIWRRNRRKNGGGSAAEGAPVSDTPTSDTPASVFTPGGDAAPGSRRTFLSRVSRAGVGLGAAGLCAWAVWLEPRRLVLRSLRFPVRDLPPGLEGLRVLHLTDLHLGPFLSEARLREVVTRANALHPDLVALTGDYVHGSPAYIPRVAQVIGALRPRLGVLAVLGNHDHWEGARESRDALGRAKVVLVENRHVFVGAQGLSTRPEGGVLCLGGVGDLWEDRPDLDLALQGVAANVPRLLLCHNPDFAETARVRRSPTRVDLMLSGHTHGGQVRLPWMGPPILPSEHGGKYARGLVAGPRFPVYVSAGVGVAVLPVRFLVPPEMTLITLIGPRPASP